MDTIPAESGPRLRHFRKRAGLSPERAGLETGLSARVIGDFERGYRVPLCLVFSIHAKNLARLAITVRSGVRVIHSGWHIGHNCLSRIAALWLQAGKHRVT